MLMPKKSKWRKQSRGRMRGQTKGGDLVSFGEFGLKALEQRFRQPGVPPKVHGAVAMHRPRRRICEQAIARRVPEALFKAISQMASAASWHAANGRMGSKPDATRDLKSFETSAKLLMQHSAALPAPEAASLRPKFQPVAAVFMKYS